MRSGIRNLYLRDHICNLLGSFERVNVKSGADLPLG